MSSGCIVHERKYLSKFHGITNQLRVKYNFNHNTLQKLKKKCCSCGERKGESSLDIDYLRTLCDQIQPITTKPIVKYNPVKLNHYVVLQPSQSKTRSRRFNRLGRFIGKHGQHLKKLEQKLNIFIHIINLKSSKNLIRSARSLGRECLGATLVLFIIKNQNYDLTNVATIKQSIEQRWNDIDAAGITPTVGRITNQRNNYVIAPSVPIETDTRWRPKKKTPKTKQKLLEKQQMEQEKAFFNPSFRSFSLEEQNTNSKKKKKR